VFVHGISQSIAALLFDDLSIGIAIVHSAAYNGADALDSIRTFLTELITMNC
jgi:hypothetical protein